VKMNKNTVAAVSLGTMYIKNPKSQEQPTDAKIERYTRNSADDLC
jgi:hypothetical protein